jgi:ribose 5-phosphate isomerase A
MQNIFMDAKRLAAEKAVEWIQDNMVVGLGTGSTAFWAIQDIGERVKEGLQIRAVATSVQTEELAKERNIPIVPFSDIRQIDVTIDGADEVDRNGYLIKGGGGALLREKIVAYHSTTYLIVVDESKLVEQLGKFPLPVEMVPFAAELTVKKLEESFGPVQIRQRNGKNFVTDNGNLIADLHSFPITDPEKVNAALHAIPGVVETGLFLNKMVRNVIVANKEGNITIRTFPA